MLQVKMCSGTTSQTNHIIDLLGEAIVKASGSTITVTTPEKNQVGFHEL